jgi:hypothetical protein
MMKLPKFGNEFNDLIWPVSVGTVSTGTVSVGAVGMDAVSIWVPVIPLDVWTIVAKHCEFKQLLTLRALCKGIRTRVKIYRIPGNYAARVNNEVLSRFPDLTYLSVMFMSDITDSAIAKITSLTELSVSYASLITDAGIVHLTNLTKLTIVSDYTGTITSKSLVQLRSLTCLDVSYCMEVDDEFVSPLVGLVELNISYNHLISNNGIRGLTNLRQLYIDGESSQINLTGIRHLENLEVLSIKKNWRFATGDGVLRLPKLRKLIT